ncbi:MAG: hypothetical protein KGH96_23085, partial [Sphingomonadales bacterium]|nr:hypothetical protein [Sphingomonadales bacterium]
ENVVSITWHLDEKTPHAHVVSMPIVTREHKRRGRKRKDQTEAAPVTKTTLAADQLRGGSKYALEKEHDEWAAFVSHLGLKRGQRGSQLSAEELRDRRLRDRQASLAGERRAGERQAEVEQSAAAMLHLRQMGEKDRDGLIEQGRVQAEAQLAAAKIDAENIRKAALAEASEAKAAADRRAGELDQRELALANQSTLHLAEAKARAQSLANREAKVAEGEKSLAVERVQIGRNLARAEAKARSLDLREKALTAKETTLSGLIAELEPVLATVRGALERLRTAPAEVLHWLDPAGAVAKAARAGNSLMDQAKAVVRSHGDQPRAQGQKPITVPQEPPGGDLSVQAAFAAQKEGLGR